MSESDDASSAKPAIGKESGKCGNFGKPAVAFNALLAVLLLSIILS